MLMSRTRKFIFVHIYKNAGRSITTALLPFAANKWQWVASRVLRKLNVTAPFDPSPFPMHVKAPEIISAMGREAYDSYFSFAIVRNPWDWQVSLYNFSRKTPAHHQHELTKGFGSFDKYIRWRCKEEVRYQKDFIYSDTNQLLVDFVGRYERLDADFQVMCSRIGVSTSLPKLNVSKERPYQEYYTEETRELVRQTFDSDIKLLGYDF
jgi:hypothetical protein